MTVDLEARVRHELNARSGDVGPWGSAGSTLRRTAAERRTRRLRAGGGVVAVMALVAVVAAVALSGGRRDAEAPPSLPTGIPTPTPATGGFIRVPVPAEVQQKAATDLALGNSTLLASARLPRSGDTVLVFSGANPGRAGTTTVSTVTVHDGTPLTGTVSDYHNGTDVMVAQPARDGTGATFVVVAPPNLAADTAVVTSSVPGETLEETAVALDHGVAVVEVSDPETVTRVRLMRNGETIRDAIPGDFLLGPRVPRPLDRVMAIAPGDGKWPLSGQIRTDGSTACSLTASGIEPQTEVFVLGYDTFDESCARIDGSLQLLLPKDRHYSTVQGLVPPGTRAVRLHWNGTAANTVPVPGGHTAFFDTSGRSPDRLLMAEALDAAGNVLATARP
jgi:hypothetical protein